MPAQKPLLVAQETVLHGADTTRIYEIVDRFRALGLLMRTAMLVVLLTWGDLVVVLLVVWSGGGFHSGSGEFGGGSDGVVAEDSVCDQVLWWIEIGCLVSVTNSVGPPVTDY
ncbi:Hypothetical predicted protein [Olea europaea subsp. europaea]|uniref:Uncharacterized protein n=1 Tax=Olea europaea subsp. europaea TaxID=158383 RepID=A0A8S0SVQ6_OLEEU|nr:Hypothetical predicted protein [Olea europaea subsp. europaea]